MLCESTNLAIRRYTRRFLSSMVIYAAVLLTVVWIFKHWHPSGLIAYPLAVLPALPIVAGITIAGLYLVEEKDEFQRAVFVQSMIWGIGATLVFTTIWGFLELFAGIQHFQTYLAFPLFCAFGGIASYVLKARYR